MSAALYQSVLRALLLKSVWTGVKHALADDIFLDTNTRLLLAQIDHCHSRISDRDVTPHDLQCALETAHRGDLLSDLLVYAEAVRQVDPAPEHVVRELLARELLDQTAQSIIDSRNSGAVDIDTPANLVARAKEVVSDSSSIPTLTLTDTNLPAFGTERGKVISLGVSKKLDDVFDGGIGLGEVVIYVGPPNRGKTTFLCASGAAAVMDGNNVLHITLGDSGPGKILRLYERCALRASKSEFSDVRSAEARIVLGARGGRLAIKDMRSIDASIDTLEGVILAHARATGAPVDLVVLDYLELVAYGRGDRRGQEIRHHYGYVARQAKRMTNACNTRLLSAWQANREGWDADTLTPKHLSECWDIFKHIDGGITLNRSAAEKANKRMRLGTIKQREDDEAPPETLIYADYAHMRMEDLDAATQAA